MFHYSCPRTNFWYNMLAFLFRYNTYPFALPSCQKVFIGSIQHARSLQWKVQTSAESRTRVQKSGHDGLAHMSSLRKPLTVNILEILLQGKISNIQKWETTIRAWTVHRFSPGNTQFPFGKKWKTGEKIISHVFFSIFLNEFSLTSQRQKLW